MSFTQYAEYKKAGEWVQDIPAHWAMTRIRRISRRYSGGTPDKTIQAFWHNGTIPWLNSGAVNDRVIVEPSAYISQRGFEHSSARWVPEGALVMALAGQGKTKGMVAQVAMRTTCNQSMAAIIPGPSMAARFLFWWLESNYQNIRNMAGGDLRDGLNLELLGNIPCPVPPVDEQEVIASFLNSETEKIDRLVDAQRRLINLLNEKRQAVISHAVTKGLTPDGPMKPSGVEWLGDVPAQWDLKALRRLRCLVQTGPFGSQLHAAEYVTGGTPVVNPTNMINGRIVPNDQSTVTGEVLDRLAHQRLLAGDIVFARRGELGRCALVADSEAGWLCGTGSMIVRFPQGQYCPPYLAQYLSLDVIRQYFESFSIGSTMDSISSSTVLAMPVLVPSPREQQEIAGFINTASIRFDELCLEAGRAIELLQERRTALISAAVTGQIDVRGQPDRRFSATS